MSVNKDLFFQLNFTKTFAIFDKIFEKHQWMWSSFLLNFQASNLYLY